MPSGSSPLDTPMMQQFQRAKAEVGDAILFFRLGDFYEMFHDDAVVASKALDLTLTARGKEGGAGGYPMCGVPYHAADAYVARLVKQGFRVALCDQVEDPRQAKGIVRREVVRIVTPATAVDPRSLQPGEGSFLCAILLEQGRVGLAHVDVSTGELRFSEHDPVGEREQVAAELSRFSPREVLVPEGAPRDAVAELFRGAALPPFTEVDGWTFSRQHARDLVAESFRVASLGAFGLESRPAATRAVGAALAYLTNALKTPLAHLEPPRLVDSQSAAIDPTTRRNLEIVENLQDGGREGTLLSVLDRTCTAMGSRTLRGFLLAPLRDAGAIDERLDAVASLMALPTCESVRSCLEGVGDLERMLSRVVLGSASPRDLHSLGAALARVPALKAALAPCKAALLGRLASDLDPVDDLRAVLEAALVDPPPPTVREGGFVREGFHRELDDLRSIARDGRAHLAALELRERERTGIGSLKVRHVRVFGYYIEVSKPHLDKVPPDYRRRQTLATVERFSTPELEELEAKILTASDRSLALEAQVFADLRARVAREADRLRSTARALGLVDAFRSLAEAAAAHGYCRPVVDDSTTLSIRGGRHPVVELRGEALAGPGLGTGRFVPNDTEMDGGSRQVLVLTGPNMGGKSTYLRQVGLVVVMAQAGSFVPAERARVGVADAVFARVGASDSLATGQSTFMVEMVETARILNEATPKSLLILDEIGRGTATFDGLSIAWAVAEHLHETPRVAARTLFATHYHELTELAALLPRVKNLRMATREWEGEIVFLHRVEEGAGDRSYGIQVARLAGLPPAVIARAREVLANLEKDELDPAGRPRLAQHGAAPREAAGPPPSQLALFATVPEDPRLRALAERLRSLDVDGLSPRQALDALAELQASARELGQ